MKPDLLKNHWGLYTRPTLVARKNDLTKKWFIQFYFADHESCINPRDLPPIQRAYGINYFKTVISRTKQGNAQKQVIVEDLANDWHPRKDCYPTLKITPDQEWQNKTVLQALADVFAKMDLAPDSKKDYRLALEYFTEA